MDRDAENLYMGILRSDKLTPTRLRLKTLKALHTSQKAFSFQEMHDYFGKAEDRASLYRVLNDLSKCKAIHRIADIDGVARFVYLESVTPYTPLFRCQQCQTIYSLPALPEAYREQLEKETIHHASILFLGVCRNCKKEK